MADQNKNGLVAEIKNHCLYCKTGVNTGVKCTICKGWLHNACALRITGLKVVSGSKGLIQCNCTSKEVKSTQTSTGTTENKVNVEISHTDTTNFQVIITSKNEIISELRDNKILQNKTIKLLEEKVQVLEQKQITHSDCDPKDKVLKPTDHTVNKQNLQVHGTVNEKSNAANSTRSLQNFQRKKMDNIINIINLESDIHQQKFNRDPKQQSRHGLHQREVTDNIILRDEQHNKRVDEDGFSKVTYRNRRNKTTLGSSRDQCQITAVESRREIFVSRLHPNTTLDQIKAHLQDKNIKSLAVDKLPIKSDQVAAFKITVSHMESNAIQQPEVWPKYTIIRPYRKTRNFQKPASIGSSQL